MEKLKIDIIKDPHNKELHISVDHGQFATIKLNAPIEQLIKVIKDPDKYRIDVVELE